ncbi:hypothetical protein POJ06DRAFT_109762 [Lipomyces tetrasporus]|uniref:Uncharacterized protein n=1 Tax=Lipomyces tetrasporus TaxID=54092 RepID=A0AAD7VTF8_9ASCO|nr:uncharacterized protein POJ06DRAFT_109762 [Lipomyces tetrasporus]KAJ8100689.1 hypothetical protein POJ06DRAFT_109762 [Lipomyces tetrasporus]
MSTRTDSSSSKDDYISSGDRWLKLVSGELESGARNRVRRQEPTEFKRKHSHRGEHESDDEYDRRKTHSRRTHYDSSKEAQSEYDGRRSRHMTSYSNDNTKYRRSDRSTDSKSMVATKTSKSGSSEDDDDSAGEWVEAPAFSTASNQVPNLSPSAFTGKELNISRISAPSRPKKGPTLPSPADIQLMNSELNDESLEDMRAARLHSRRASEAQYLGAAENLLQGGASDPSDPRDRKIEKRQLENETRREYVRARSPGGVDEVDDDELFDGAVGGGSSSKLSEVAARRAEKDRIKKEKREAFYREKDAERRKRWEEMQAREKKTINMLRELARQKFGNVP